MQCVNCSLNLQKQLGHKVGNVNITVKTLLNNWTSPYKVKDSDVLCEPCYNIVQSHVSSGILTALRSFGHKDVCFCCGISILNKRTYNVPPNCSELEIFKAWIPDYQISVFTRSCVSCWWRARRAVQRHGLRDAIRAAEADAPPQDFDMVTVLETVPCVHCGKVCGENTMCLVMHLDNDLLRCLAIMKAPQEFSSEDYVCDQCIKFIQKNLDSDIFKIKNEPNDSTTESLNVSVKSESINSSELEDSCFIVENNIKDEEVEVPGSQGDDDMLNTSVSSYKKSGDTAEKVETFRLSNFTDSIIDKEHDSEGLDKASDEIEKFDNEIEIPVKDIEKSDHENETAEKDVNKSDNENETAEQDVPNRCVRCNKSTLRRRHKKLYNDHPIAITIADMIHPRELPRLGRICTVCWYAGKHRQEKILKLETEKLRARDDNPDGTADTVTRTNSTEKEFIKIPNYTRAPASSNNCLLAGCKGAGRRRVPKYIKLKLLTDYKMYLPNKCRVCNRHYQNFDWDKIRNNNFLTTFTGEHMEDMLNLLSESAKGNPGIEFEESEAMSPASFQFLLGITQQQFGQILDACPTLASLKRSKTALGVYLLKLKSGEPNEKLAAISVKRRTLERNLKDVRKILLDEFVPLHLGFDHISRENKVHRQLLHPKGLFGNLDSLTLVNQKYVYVLRKSASDVINVEKTSKPFLLSTSDGYILDVLGPLETKVSDSEFNQILFGEEGLLTNLFVDDDIFVLDKQSKEMFGNIMVCNYAAQSVSPLNVPEDEPASTAQDSRPKCLLRSLALSKHFALRFRQDFKHVTKMPSLKSNSQIPEDMRIAAAIMNAFYPLMTLKMTEATNRRSL